MALATRSKWTFKTSSGASGSVGELVTFGAGMGSLILRTPQRIPTNFRYQSVNAGIGVGSPVTLTFSTQDFPSEGAVYILNASRGRDLIASDFTGFCVFSEFSGGVGVAGAYTAMFVGARVPKQLTDIVARSVNGPAGILEGLVDDAVDFAKRNGTSSGQMLEGAFHKVTDMTVQSMLGPGGAKAMIVMDSVSVGFAAGFGVSGSCGWVWLAADTSQPYAEIDMQDTYVFATSGISLDDDIINLPGNLLFGFDKYKILPKATDVMKNVAKSVKARTTHRVVVSGYTDTIGEPHHHRHNMWLSAQRANAVRNWLIGPGGCDAANITAQGNGPDNPVATNKTPDGRSKNRRVEVAFIKIKP